MRGIYSRANLSISSVAAASGALAQVFFNGDGSSVAADGHALLACGPIDWEHVRVHWPDDVPLQPLAPDAGVGVGTDTVQQVQSNMGGAGSRGTGGNVGATMLCGLTRSDAKVEFTALTRVHEKRVACRPMGRAYPDWAAALRKACESGAVVQVCVSRTRLAEVLRAMDRACPDKSGDNPVYLEVRPGGVVLRAKNTDTGQHVLGLVKPLDTGGTWLLHDGWERRVLGLVTKVAKVARRLVGLGGG